MANSWRGKAHIQRNVGLFVASTVVIVLGLGLPAAAQGMRPGPSADGRAPGRPHSDDVTNCSSMASIATCVMNILAPGGGTSGVFLQQIGGSVLASVNANVPYEPASSIKPVIALYAIEQVEQGNLQLTDQIPKIDNSGGPDDCPPLTTSGTEQLGTAIQQMLQVSDNNRTLELMEYFGVANLNAFAASLGLSNTMFQTSSSPPGFNVIGCLSYGYDPLPSTVDGNTMSLDDAATLWSTIASLPAPYADALYELAAGRDMFNSQGYDFTGVWPILTTIADEEVPAGVTTAQLQSFTSHMNVSVKGGSYDVIDCDPTCQEATWWVFAGVAQIPSCTGSTVTPTNYTWGYFISDAVGAEASTPTTQPPERPSSMPAASFSVPPWPKLWRRGINVPQFQDGKTPCRRLESNDRHRCGHKHNPCPGDRHRRGLHLPRSSRDHQLG